MNFLPVDWAEKQPCAYHEKGVWTSGDSVALGLGNWEGWLVLLCRGAGRQGGVGVYLFGCGGILKGCDQNCGDKVNLT